MNINPKGFFAKKLLARIQKYDKDKYWKMRSEVVNPNSKTPKWLRFIYLYKIKKSDAFNNASMGTDMGSGAHFAETPILVHGLNGIIVSHSAKIGKKVIICQQVTVAQGPPGFPSIGNNCLIGAGAKILGHVTIGDNVKIGANAVVSQDIPPNTTAVGVPAKIVSRSE